MESKAARGGESKPGEFLFWLQTKSELELKSNMQTDMYGFNVNQQLNMMAIAVAECAELEVSGSNSWGNSLNTHSGSLPLLGGGGGDRAQNSHVCISTEDVLPSPLPPPATPGPYPNHVPSGRWEKNANEC